MNSTMVSATTSASGLSFVRVLVIVVLLGIGFPLIRRLRRIASESRRRRWVKEGLMDPPPADPEPGDSRD